MVKFHVVVSWSTLLTLEQAVQVQALARDIVLCSRLGKTLRSHGASLHPGVQMGTSKFNA